MSTTIREEAKAQRAKRDHYRKSIKRIGKNVDDAAIFSGWSKGQVREYLNKLKSDHSILDEAIIQITRRRRGKR